MILCIESTSHNCSVALFQGEKMHSFIEERSTTGYTHAEMLHVFIQCLLKDANLLSSDLSAIAVSKGPGSYTGLRIGVSAAKGLAYALNVPLISVDTLLMLTLDVSKLNASEVYMPVVDARRMELYRAHFDNALQQILPTEAAIINDEFYSVKDKNVLIFGEGAEKCSASLPSNYTVLEGVFPSSRMMGTIAHACYERNIFEDVAYFEPFYLKEFVAGVAAQKK